MAMRRKQLGAVTDNPREIMTCAIAELEAAKSLLARRQAAEKAHLALSSAVEVASKRSIRSHSEENNAVATIARKARDPYIKTDYAAIRSALHSKCFHQAECVNLQIEVGKATALMERILRTKSMRR